MALTIFLSQSEVEVLGETLRRQTWVRPSIALRCLSVARLRRRRNYSTRLNVGTKLYALKGYLPSFRLAVKQAQAILLLEAQRNPHATRGGELLDIDKKVQSIIVSKQGTPTAPIATIEDAKQVAVLIALLDEAPIHEGNSVGDTLEVLEFHLSDGTFSYLLYDPKTGWTDKNILLPPAFATLIEKAGQSGNSILSEA